MKKVKIKYVDFWYGFSEEDNFFTKLLSQKYMLEISENPEILIYSCYGRSHLKYKCIRIFYSSENVRPDFNGCDYAITFDYNDNPRHFRFPLYGIYLERENSVGQFLKGYTRDEAIKIWRGKTKFCCMVVSNGGAPKRLRFFEKLSAYKKVDSGGNILNNVGGPVKDKLKFIKEYRFVMAFENTSYPGYTTEKIIEPLIADCIPLYWGDPKIRQEFNPESILILDENQSIDAFINKIMEVDKDETLAIKMLMQPKFKDGLLPKSINSFRLQKFFDEIIGAENFSPISTTFFGKYYHFNMIRKHFGNRIKAKLIAIFH